MFKNLFGNSDRISTNEMATALQISILDSFVFVFNKTAEGVRYYENFTPEQDKESHAEAAENIMHVLNNIKDIDEHVYRILKYRYGSEIKECEELVGT